MRFCSFVFSFESHILHFIFFSTFCLSRLREITFGTIIYTCIIYYAIHKRTYRMVFRRRFRCRNNYNILLRQVRTMKITSTSINQFIHARFAIVTFVWKRAN